MVRKWSVVDPKANQSITQLKRDFLKILPPFTGLRLLNQDPTECLVSFICSQNNNIKRISMMIQKLCEKYGTLIDELDGKDYYSFPKLDQLKIATKGELMELGFGYRSKYLVSVVKQIETKGGSSWLETLRQQNTDTVIKELTKLSGIGPKVAHCISLFSLAKFDLVPVDTHVFQIGQRYLEHLKNKNPNKKNNEEIIELFTDTFCEYVGWAHTILFAAELPIFKSLLEGYGITLPPKPTKKRKNSGEENSTPKTNPKKSRKISKSNQKKPLKTQTQIIIQKETTDQLYTISERVKRRRQSSLKKAELPL